MLQSKSKRANERGNVFIIILVGVVLFAALSYSVSRGLRSDSTSRLSDREATLAASEILNYAQQVERAVNRVRRNGCSENEINFDNQILIAYNYTNASAPADGKCNIFSSEGGLVQLWDTNASGIHQGNTGDYFQRQYFGGDVMHHLDAGDTLSARTPDLILWIPDIHRNVCLSINDNLGIENTGGEPPDGTAQALGGIIFIGSYGGAPASPSREITASANELDNKLTGCFEIGLGGVSTQTIYAFYSVLLER